MSRSLALSVVMAVVCLDNPDLPAQEPVAARRSVVTDGGSSIILAASESGKTLYGYSVQTGTWEGVAVTNPGNSRPNPIVGNGVGYVAVGKRVYAFSPVTGHWTPLDLPEAAEPTISGGGRLRVDVGTRIYMFSAVTGRWATIDLAVDKG
jgi:hypothetical protein